MIFYFALIVLINFVNGSYQQETLLNGEWLSLNEEQKKIYNFKSNDVLTIEQLSSSQNSLYPQNFNFKLENKKLILFDDQNRIVDELEIVKIDSKYLKIISRNNGRTIILFRTKLDYNKQKIDKFLSKSLKITFQKSSKNNIFFMDNDIVYNDSCYCIKQEYPILQSDEISINRTILIAKFHNEYKEVYIDSFNDKKLKGRILDNDVVYTINIELFNSEITELDSIELMQYMGNYILFTDSTEFYSKLKTDKNTKTIYINHPSLKFKKNQTLEISTRNENDTGFWKILQIQNQKYIAFNFESLESKSWEVIGEVSRLASNYLIIEIPIICVLDQEAIKNGDREFIYLLKK